MQGCLIALDRTKPKVAKLDQNVQRFGLSSVHCFAHDSTKSVDTAKLDCKREQLALDRLLKQHYLSYLLSSVPCSPPYPPEVFDRILLDGPCSALGQRPQACYQLSLKELCSFQPYQRKLFKQVHQLFDRYSSHYSQPRLSLCWSLEEQWSTLRAAFLQRRTNVRFTGRCKPSPASG